MIKDKNPNNLEIRSKIVFYYTELNDNSNALLNIYECLKINPNLKSC